jgi:hypothetical protein
MNVTKVIKHHGNFIVTANVDGNYDKRGLPVPGIGGIRGFCASSHASAI